MRKLAALASVALIGAAPPPKEPPPGEGVLCTMVFVDVAAETGRRCFAGQDPALQVRLESAEAKLDAYLLKYGPASPKELAAFKREQAGVGRPMFDCTPKGDSVMIYQRFRTADAQKVWTELDKTLARPGKPTWGDCV